MDCRALLAEYRAAVHECGALSAEYRVFLAELKALLVECRALFVAHFFRCTCGASSVSTDECVCVHVCVCMRVSTEEACS